MFIPSEESKQVYRLLLELVKIRPRLDPEQVQRLNGTVFRNDFLLLARRHRVLSLAVSQLLASGIPLREPTVRLLEQQRLQVRRWLGVCDLEKDRVHEWLAERGIQPVFLKGVAVAQSVYSDPLDRQLSDIDLLVTEAELKPAIRALVEQGYRCNLTYEGIRDYRRHHFHYQLQHPRGLIVEVHWAVTRPDRLFRLEPDAMLEQATTHLCANGITLRIPRAEHAVLHAVLQNLQEGFARLDRIVDLDRIIAGTPGFDWEWLLGEAHRARLRKPLALSLKLAKNLLETEVPRGYIRRLGTHPIAAFHIRLFSPGQFLLEQQSKQRATAFNLLQVWLLPGSRLKVRSLWHLLRTTTHDPLDWIWKSRKPGGATGKSFATRAATLGKMIIYQGFLYARGVARGFQRLFGRRAWD